MIRSSRYQILTTVLKAWKLVTLNSIIHLILWILKLFMSVIKNWLLTQTINHLLAHFFVFLFQLLGQNGKTKSKSWNQNQKHIKIMIIRIITLHIHWTFEDCIFHGYNMPVCCNMGCGSWYKIFTLKLVGR